MQIHIQSFRFWSTQGRQATANAKESIAWGTNIVGGVRPGKSGEHLGLPVLPSVREVSPESRYLMNLGLKAPRRWKS